MAKRPKPEEICKHCGGSGYEPPPRTRRGPTSKQRKVMDGHSFCRHELFKLMDRDIARQVLPLEAEYQKPEGARLVDVYEEASAYVDKAGEAFQAANKQLALKCLYHAATNLVYMLESFEFGPMDLAEENDGDETTEPE